jgi:hypothetical protein
MTSLAWWRTWRGWLQAARLLALANVAFVALAELGYTRVSGEFARRTGDFSLAELFMYDNGPWRGPLAWSAGGLAVVVWALMERRHRLWAEIVRLVLALLATAAFFVLDLEIFELANKERLVGAFLADLSVTVFLAASIALATFRPRPRSFKDS